MEVTTIGIDLAKNVFAVCAADSSGRVVIRRQPPRPSRSEWAGPEQSYPAGIFPSPLATAWTNRRRDSCRFVPGPPWQRI
jgi:hypothetical protein